jgi:hypothetical protein
MGHARIKAGGCQRGKAKPRKMRKGSVPKKSARG